MIKYSTLTLSVFLWLGTGWAHADYANRPEVEQFISSMESKHEFDSGELRKMFAKTRYQQSIIDAITRPAEGKPWHQYRAIFVTESRITKGVEFWKDNLVALKRAEERFGVPPEMIVAIIGVETFYGRHSGNYRVVDALATLGFDYPPRARFFRKQLGEFLIMSREEGVDPLSMTGSYAGAMGMAQFIPSSFRSYAIDFDGDQRRDLWKNSTDAIGSVANYFAIHHWRNGQPVAGRATVSGDQIDALVKKGYKPHTSVAKFRQAGVTPNVPYGDEQQAALLGLKGRNGQEHWLALHNFYVITRYNHSPLYAMAAYQLSAAIKSSYREQGAPPSGGK